MPPLKGWGNHLEAKVSAAEVAVVNQRAGHKGQTSLSHFPIVSSPKQDHVVQAGFQLRILLSAGLAPLVFPLLSSDHSTLGDLGLL